MKTSFESVFESASVKLQVVSNVLY